MASHIIKVAEVQAGVQIRGLAAFGLRFFASAFASSLARGTQPAATETCHMGHGEKEKLQKKKGGLRNSYEKDKVKAQLYALYHLLNWSPVMCAKRLLYFNIMDCLKKKLPQEGSIFSN